MVKISSIVRGLILDMDGVLWRGEKTIGDLPSIFKTINQRGYKTILATNNATRSVEQYHNKLISLGVHLENWQIINSSIATGHYLSERYPQGANIFVVGESALAEALAGYGFKNSLTGNEVAAVVVALDRSLSYEKLRRAALLIRSGAAFIGTNPDPTFPEPGGLVPGAGALLALVEKATDVKPTVIGKPEPGMYQIALERLGTAPEETLVIGDRLETDIAGAQALYCPCALVLSGVTNTSQANEWEPAPDIIAQDLQSVLEMI